MGRKYEKPAVYEFEPIPKVLADGVSPLGYCTVGVRARGTCDEGTGVVDPGGAYDCKDGAFVIRYCNDGTGVVQCYTGTKA